jgi:hypothetical protein
MSSSDQQDTTTKNNFLTIVSGLPRSGTSMMMRILHAAGIPVLIDETRDADEDNPRGYFEFEAVKKTKQDESWLSDSNGKAVKLVYRLLQDLPDDHNYRVIFMRRDMREIHASQETMLERNNKTSQSMVFREFEQLFGDDLRRILRWANAKANFRILEINYRDMVLNPRPQLETISSFLGGGLAIDSMQAVVETKLYRKRA